MKWSKVLLALARCELKATYGGFGWQVSARGALPVFLVVAALMTVLLGHN